MNKIEIKNQKYAKIERLKMPKNPPSNPVFEQCFELKCRDFLELISKPLHSSFLN